MTSSIRLMNSGENSRRSSFRTISSTSRAGGAFLPSPKPTRAWLTRNFVPMFDVMMMSVFLKSTVVPVGVGQLPSSRICSRRFAMSGWAFSISSKRMTE